MKSFFIFSLLFVSTLLNGQTKSKIIRKTNIDISNVDHLRLGKYLKKAKHISDTCWNAVYRNLDNEQTKYILDQWNESEYIGEKKLKPKYCIEVYLKDGTKKYVNLNNGLNEIKHYWFRPKDEKYFDNLWDNAKE